MKNMWKKFTSEESGQGMVEYGLIIALIAVVLIAVLVAMRQGLQGTFTDIAEALDNPGEAGENP